PDNTIKLWDVPAGTVRTTLAGHAQGAFCVTFSPDGTTLASCGHHYLWWSRRARPPFNRGGSVGEVTPWDARTGQVRWTLRLPHPVMDIAFSPDGGTLAVNYSYPDEQGWNQGEVRLWDAATGRQRATLRATGNVGHVAFSPDGRTLA